MGLTATENNDSQTCCDSVRSCCTAKALCCQSKLPRNDKQPSDNVVAWRALACHGQSLNWLAAPVAPPPPLLEAGDLLPPAGWLRASLGSLLPGRSDEPAIPPPRCV
jgi:hypothetical protein